VVDASFRQVYAFFIVEHYSRRIVHVGVTRHPTDAWVAQQLREATPFGEHPKHLIRDNDAKFGLQFARASAGSGIEILKTLCHDPKPMRFVNAFWTASDVNASTISSFLVSAISTVCCRNMRLTLIWAGHVKVSISKFQCHDHLSNIPNRVWLPFRLYRF
jgi:hypothetical protein